MKKTITAMAEFFSKKLGVAVSTKEITATLEVLGFLKNGEILKEGAGEVKQTSSYSYILWEEEIFNEEFEKSLKKIKGIEEESKKERFLKASEIATILGIQSFQVNQAFVNIGYLQKLEDKKGYLLLKEELGIQKKYEETYSAVWNPNILEDDLFKKEIESIGEKADGALEEKQEFKFDRQTFPANIRTQSGHYVRSRAELVVADFLYHKDIMFSYERRVPIKEEMYSDFYIKKSKDGKGVFIEVWGLESTKYLERKEKKKEIYKNGGFNLIGLEDKDIENIDDFLTLELLKYGIQLS